jgi:hypothetical protein
MRRPDIARRQRRASASAQALLGLGGGGAQQRLDAGGLPGELDGALQTVHLRGAGALGAFGGAREDRLSAGDALERETSAVFGGVNLPSERLLLFRGEALAVVLARREGVDRCLLGRVARQRGEERCEEVFGCQSERRLQKSIR